MPNNDNKEILVSICSITYNHALFIRQCLDGFIMQKCDFDFEILIHDDASTDETSQIISEYQNKYPNLIKPIYQTENQWSKGERRIQSKYNFSRAQGKYIALCEGDDYWTDPLKLQKQVDFLESNLEYVVCHHSFDVIDGEGTVVKDRSTDMKNDYSSEEMAIGKAFMSTNTMLFRNVQIPIVKGDIVNGDVFLTSQLSKFGKAKFLSSVKPSNYRIHSGGVWSTANEITRINYQLKSRRVIRENVDKTFRKQLTQILFNLELRKFYYFQRSGNRTYQIYQVIQLFKLDSILLFKIGINKALKLFTNKDLIIKDPTIFN